MDGKNIDADPMQMPRWSIGMACVWIVCRNPEKATNLWSRSLEDILLEDGIATPDPTHPSRVSINETPNEAIQDARDTLVNAMREGAVKATGLLSGVRSHIEATEWEDMVFSYELREDGLAHRACNSRDEMYFNILVARQDVLDRWPEDTKPPEYYSGLPGRPNSSHLILGEHCRRLKAGEAHKKVSEEARALQDWLQTEYPNSPSSGAASIENSIRKQHRDWPIK